MRPLFLGAVVCNALVVCSALPLACGYPADAQIGIVTTDSTNLVSIQPVDLPTLTDPVAMSGSIATFYLGGQFSLFRAVLSSAPLTERALDSFTSPPATPRIDYVVSSGEGGKAMLVATDYEGLAMATTYYHLQTAYDTFLAAGWIPTAISQKVTVLFQPEIPDAALLGFPPTDNAAYVSLIDAFMVFPQKILDGLPLPMNPGVIAHEFGHRVFQGQAFRGDPSGKLVIAQRTNGIAQINIITSIDEGLADFFAAVVTGNPNFIAPSTPASEAARRRLDTVRTMPAEYLDGTQPVVTVGENSVYDPYAPGAVVSSLLWRLRAAGGGNAELPALLAAETAFGTRITAGSVPSYADFLSDLADALDSSLLSDYCALLEEIFAANCSDWQAACAGTGVTC
jgi:hypothetical protein